MNMNQKRKSCRMVSNLRHILFVRRRVLVEILTTLLLILLFLFHLAILPGLIWDIYLKPCNSDWALNPQSLFSVSGCSMSSLLGLSCPKACQILLPQSWSKPMSPALQGRFLTTGYTRAVPTPWSFCCGHTPSLRIQ